MKYIKCNINIRSGISISSVGYFQNEIRINHLCRSRYTTNVQSIGINQYILPNRFCSKFIKCVPSGVLMDLEELY